MNSWLQLFVFAILLGFSKAHHFVRLVILAGLGLAGLWMVHTLAQDYDKISHNVGQSIGKIGQNFGLASAGVGGKSDGEEEALKLFKRSVNERPPPEINWALVLSRDPASCARSFICQLTAQEDKDLSREERVILEMTSYSAQKDTWASKQLREAFRNGQQASNANHCLKIYKYCPYTSRTMMNLIKFFGR